MNRMKRKAISVALTVLLTASVTAAFPSQAHADIGDSWSWNGTTWTERAVFYQEWPLWSGPNGVWLEANNYRVFKRYDTQYWMYINASQQLFTPFMHSSGIENEVWVTNTVTIGAQSTLSFNSNLGVSASAQVISATTSAGVGSSATISVTSSVQSGIRWTIPANYQTGTYTLAYLQKSSELRLREWSANYSFLRHEWTSSSAPRYYAVWDPPLIALMCQPLNSQAWYYVL
jgi:hypothetical protein